MIVVLSTFRVANGTEEAVRAAFASRPHRVDAAPGFVRMEVLRPRDDPAEFWLLTWWADEASYRAWHDSPAFRESQRQIPRSMRLAPGSAELRLLECVAD